MAVDSTTVVVLLEPPFNVFESLEVFFKVLLSGGGWVVILLNSKEDKVIFIQFIDVHGSTIS